MMAPKAGRLLRDWLRDNDLTARAFSESIEVSEESISRWVSGRLVPSRCVRLAIEYVTSSHVPAASWDQP